MPQENLSTHLQPTYGRGGWCFPLSSNPRGRPYNPSSLAMTNICARFAPPMCPPLHHSIIRCQLKSLLLLTIVCLIGTACSTNSQTGNAISEDPRGAVSLQAMGDPSIQASHPIHLEPALIARVLSGMQIQERQRGLQELLGGSASAVPVFSVDEVQFLTPRIVKALATAGTGETVAFLVKSPRQGTGRLEHSVTETTAGSLYAYGLSLYVTLSQYRYAPTQPNDTDPARRRLLDSSGLSNRTLLFTPSAAQRSDSFHPPAGGSPLTDFSPSTISCCNMHRHRQQRLRRRHLRSNKWLRRCLSLSQEPGGPAPSRNRLLNARRKSIR